MLLLRRNILKTLLIFWKFVYNYDFETLKHEDCGEFASSVILRGTRGCTALLCAADYFVDTLRLCKPNRDVASES